MIASHAAITIDRSAPRARGCRRVKAARGCHRVKAARGCHRVKVCHRVMAGIRRDRAWVIDVGNRRKQRVIESQTRA
jgi:hypothetical protein